MEQYGFECECSACEEESKHEEDERDAFKCQKCEKGFFYPTPRLCLVCGETTGKEEFDEIEEKLKKSEEASRESLTYELANNHTEAYNSLKTCFELQREILHPKNYLFKDTLERGTYLCIQIGDFKHGYDFS